MGRTIQTMTQLVAQEEAAWAPFRRALRAEDREIFDRLFAAARHHSAPAHYASHATPFDAMLVAMILETMKAVEQVRRDLERMKGEGGAAAGGWNAEALER
ncbi:MAG: hypothetical protein QN173_03345 [Armatimonadota bacterium]|nr:hypothetical protein [Armatimonadota bacterium]MDR7400796.1 hypothetical protein [Armatimonadota bacterium]MDR7403867.1 hypothetical protein [Armatimonadota bacterium]MDR7436610.1 hypothetical protein [Armatimonadota bacterium]MDR7472971.1 hypothetical protein [Armatimonadota bacterium]